MPYFILERYHVKLPVVVLIVVVLISPQLQILRHSNKEQSWPRSSMNWKEAPLDVDLESHWSGLIIILNDYRRHLIYSLSLPQKKDSVVEFEYSQSLAVLQTQIALTLCCLLQSIHLHPVLKLVLNFQRKILTFKTHT